MTVRRPRRKLSSLRLWLAPGMAVKRHVLVAVLGGLLLIIGVILVILWGFAGDRAVISDPIEEILVSPGWERWGVWVAVLLMAVGLFFAVFAIGRLNRSLLSHWLDRPSDAAELLFEELKLSKGPRIVALGGGTGLSMLLRGLRSHTSNITAVVSVADDGGSSGRLREAFNMPAPGDLSDCLAALSDRDQELGKLLQFRFSRGDELRGHTFGNLLITTLTEVQGDFGAALDSLNSLLDLKGHVYPAASEPVSLLALKPDGTEVRGESALREIPGRVARLRIEPEDVSAMPRVAGQLKTADVIVLGPGSLFSSTIPPLLVREIRQALAETNGSVIYVCNIMTEAGETDGMSAFDHVRALHEHIGIWPDMVVVNSQPLDAARLAAYESENAVPVGFAPEEFEERGVSYVLLDLIADGEQAYHETETLTEWLLGYAKKKQAEIWAGGRRSGYSRMEVTE